MLPKIKRGKLCGEKVQYPDGIGCSVWYPFEDDDSAGLCFDFPFEDIDDLIALLQAMKDERTYPLSFDKKD